jgi:hypothetical protein
LDELVTGFASNPTAATVEKVESAVNSLSGTEKK